MELSEFIQKLIGHLIIYGFSISLFIFGLWILLVWMKKNFKFKLSPIIKIEGISSTHAQNNIKSDVQDIKKDLGVVDVDYKKNIFVSDVDTKSVKMDEEKKGKVKTNKDKLKKLRGS